jgi:hypothetical protein
MRAMRLHRDRQLHSRTLTHAAPAIDAAGHEQAWRASPERSLIAREDDAIVGEFISELTDLERRVFALVANGRPTGTVRFEGQVLGVVPPHGVVVEVLVYYLGQWQPIRTPRTSSAGRFQVSYRFNHAFGQFPFRLRVRDGQVGFPYREGCSKWVSVVI